MSVSSRALFKVNGNQTNIEGLRKRAKSMFENGVSGEKR
jgi:hypothetical protein